MRDRFQWARLLAFVTGLVNQELLQRNEYLAAENRILRARLPARLRLSDAERATLAEIAKRLGRKALHEIARVAKPETLLAWYRRLVAHKFDGSRRRAYPGRPRVSPEIEALVVRFARENRGWGYDRIVGALANLGYQVSDQTVGNILRRHSIPPAPERSRTTAQHEYFACRGIVHFNVTAHPTAEWTAQQLREAFPFDQVPRYLPRDRDCVFGAEFRKDVKAMGIKEVLSAPRSPWQRAFVERVIGTLAASVWII